MLFHLEVGSPVRDSCRERGWQNCLQHMHTICSSAVCKEGSCCRNPLISSRRSHVRHTFLVYTAAITRALPVHFFCPLLHRAALYLDSGLNIRNFIGPWNIKKSSKITHIVTFLLKGGPTNLHSLGPQVKTSGVLLSIMMGVNCCWLFLSSFKKKIISEPSPQHVIRAQRAINNEMAHQLYVLQVLTFNLLEDRMMTKMDPQDQVSAHETAAKAHTGEKVVIKDHFLGYSQTEFVDDDIVLLSS